MRCVGYNILLQTSVYLDFFLSFFCHFYLGPFLDSQGVSMAFFCFVLFCNMWNTVKARRPFGLYRTQTHKSTYNEQFVSFAIVYPSHDLSFVRWAILVARMIQWCGKFLFQLCLWFFFLNLTYLVVTTVVSSCTTPSHWDARYMDHDGHKMFIFCVPINSPSTSKKTCRMSMWGYIKF